jgi:hypothetical protein
MYGLSAAEVRFCSTPKSETNPSKLVMDLELLHFPEGEIQICGTLEFFGSYGSNALYQGTTLVGP